MFQSGLEEQVVEVEASLLAIAERLDPDDIPASEAPRLFERFDRIARSARAARTVLARRVADSQVWKRNGYRTAEEYLAATTGTSLGGARSEMETSRALPSLPDTRAGLLAGTLSPDQGCVIAGAAAANPAAEGQLVQRAGQLNLQELRHEAAKAKAAADPDPDATHRRLHRQRRCSRYTDAEGARHLHLQGPVDAVSVIEAELDRRLDRLIRDHPAGQPLESRDALAFDAAVAMARRSAGADQPDDGAPTGTKRRPRQPRPEHLALLRLDVAALWRGHVEGDELCEITGLGPIPVTVARRLLGDAVLKLIITRGDAVAQVTSLTRGPTQAMRYAKLWTSPTCCVEGCSRTVVEYDHAWGVEYAATRHTRLDELDRVCTSHHDLHTRHGWALVTGTGKRAMVPPDHPHHPAHSPPGDPPPTPRPSPEPRPTSALPPPTATRPPPHRAPRARPPNGTHDRSRTARNPQLFEPSTG